MGYDVFGIGSALVDFLLEVDESMLEELKLTKGHFHQKNPEEAGQVLNRIRGEDIKLAPGGSAANTIAGVAHLGGRAVFCGKVGDDEHGRFYEIKMKEGDVRTNLPRHEKTTGHAVTFITPDGERTFSVYYGAAHELAKEDILEGELKDCKILHIEGYQIDHPDMKQVSLHAVDIAKRHGLKISIDLSDPSVVNRNLQFLKGFVRENADIVFANEEEAEAFTGKHGEEALHLMGEICETVVVKLGGRGSLIKHKGKIYKIKPYKTKVIDTTGAGDMYAAGILYGMTQGMDMETCGKIASYAAAKAVSKIGARLDSSIREEVQSIK